MTTAFSLTYDYLCPFAYGANRAVAEAVAAGAAWEVRYRPFSLAATKVTTGEPAVWERPDGTAGTRGVLAHKWAIAARESDPDSFMAFHLNLFSARHEHARDIGDPDVLWDVAAESFFEPGSLAAIVNHGSPAEILAREHTEVSDRWSVFGVPTFIIGGEAVFVRLMDYTSTDVDRVVDMLEWSNLNEFKRTPIPR